jgi:heat shock protein HslJ
MHRSEPDLGRGRLGADMRQRRAARSTNAALAFGLAFVALLATACDSEAPPERGGDPGPSVLSGSEWSVVSVDGRAAPLPGKEPSVAFAAGTVTGDGGCNRFSGNYRYEPTTGQITFQELAMTARGCLDDRLNAFETSFMQAFGTAQQAGIDGPRLVLTSPGHRIVLVPRATDAASPTD